MWESEASIAMATRRDQVCMEDLTGNLSHVDDAYCLPGLMLMMRTVYLDTAAWVQCHLMLFVSLFQAEARGERTERKVSRNCFCVW